MQTNSFAIRAFSVLSLTAVCLCAGCAIEGVEPSEAASLHSDTDALRKDRIGELKHQISAISSANTKRVDNMAAVSAQLAPLVAELQRLTPVKTQAQNADLLEGAWHQLWGNLEMMSPGFIRQDLTEVFQVVSKDGYYYNFGSNCIFSLLPATGILRGKYTSSDAGFDIEFTKVGFRIGALNEDRDLVAYTKKFEFDGKRILATGSGRAPKGPVGIKGHLTTLYVDEDFRIAGGDQTAFADETGTVLVPGRDNLLFVLERHTPSARRF